MDGRRRWTVVLVLAGLLLGAVAWFPVREDVDLIGATDLETEGETTADRAQARLLGNESFEGAVDPIPTVTETVSPDRREASAFARVLARIMKGAVYIIDEAARAYTPPGDRDVWRWAWGDAIGRLASAQGAIDGHLRVAVALVRVATAVEDGALSGLLIDGIAGSGAGALRATEPSFHDLRLAIRNHLLAWGDAAAAERLAGQLAQHPDSALLLLVAIDWRAWERSLDLGVLDAPIEAAQPSDGLLWAMKHVDVISAREDETEARKWLDVFETRISPLGRRAVLIHAFARLGPRGAIRLLQSVVASGVPVGSSSLNGLASAWVSAPDRRGELSDIATALAEALLQATTPSERIQFANALFPIPADDISESAADLIRLFLRRPPDEAGEAVFERVARSNTFSALSRKIEFSELLTWAEGAIERSDMGVLSIAVAVLTGSDAPNSAARSRVVVVVRAALGTGDRLTTQSALKLISRWNLTEARPALEALIEGPGRNGEIVNGEIVAAAKVVLASLSR